MGIRAALTASVMTFTLILAGCGSDEPSDEPTTEATDGGAENGEAENGGAGVEGATGVALEGEGYSLNAPDGWESQPDMNPMADVMAVDLNDDDGFADNLNVLVLPNAPRGLTPERLAESARSELEATGVTDITEHGEVDLDGATGVHLSSIFTINELTYRVHQFLVAHDGSMFTTTFSFSEDLPEADRAAVYESVMATWTWN